MHLVDNTYEGSGDVCYRDSMLSRNGNCRLEFPHDAAYTLSSVRVDASRHWNRQRKCSNTSMQYNSVPSITQPPRTEPSQPRWIQSMSLEISSATETRDGSDPNTYTIVAWSLTLHLGSQPFHRCLTVASSVKLPGCIYTSCKHRQARR